jgi:hypothetical protein
MDRDRSTALPGTDFALSECVPPGDTLTPEQGPLAYVRTAGGR